LKEERDHLWGAKMSVLPQIADLMDCAPNLGTPHGPGIIRRIAPDGTASVVAAP